MAVASFSSVLSTMIVSPRSKSRARSRTGHPLPGAGKFAARGPRPLPDPHPPRCGQGPPAAGRRLGGRRWDPLDAGALCAWLGLPPERPEWLAALEDAEPVPPPSPEGAAAALARLGAEPEDIAAVLAALPAPGGDAELSFLLERCAGLLRAHARLGPPARPLHWPPLPAGLGSRGRLFLAAVCLGAEAEARRLHAAAGVPEAVSSETLQTLGWALGMYRRLHGEPGFFEAGWHTQAFRGCLYQLGRLQFTADVLGPGDAAAIGPGFREGERAAGVHIPETGPLAPEAVTASLIRAGDLFRGAAPWGPCRVGVCDSWLLDGQLASDLPATSNIVRFQRLFRPLPGHENADRSIFQFVFHRAPTEDLDALPQRTTLERALVAHWRRGGHWHACRGWLWLPRKG